MHVSGIHDGGRVRFHQLDARRSEQDGAGAFVVERPLTAATGRTEVERSACTMQSEADGLQHARGMADLVGAFGPMSVTLSQTRLRVDMAVVALSSTHTVMSWL